MQMGGVACLGWKDSSEEGARNLRKESSENVLSWRGLNKGRGKMVIFRMSNMVKMILSEWSQRNREVGFRITCIGVASKNIKGFDCQGPIYKNLSTNQSLTGNTENVFGRICFPE